jgi:hypothetical protein
MYRESRAAELCRKPAHHQTLAANPQPDPQELQICWPSPFRPFFEKDGPAFPFTRFFSLITDNRVSIFGTLAKLMLDCKMINSPDKECA